MTTPSPVAPPRRGRPAWLDALIPGLLVAVVVGVFASAFIWPMKASEPGGIRFGLAGSNPQIAEIGGQLAQKQPGLFEIAPYADRDAVLSAIRSRDVEAGLVAGNDGIELLTASAGNAQVAQLVAQLAAGMKEQQAVKTQQGIAAAVAKARSQGMSAERILALQEQLQQKASSTSVKVTDVVPGGSLAGAANLVMLPALIGGMATAMLAFFMVRRPLHRIITLLSAASLAGLVGASVLGPWFGVLTGSFGLNALALGMGVLAIGATITGLATLLGKAGLGVGAVLMMLIGNPWGGMMVPHEFLPGFMGWLGAHMPNGNVITLVKNLNFFPEAPQSGQWWILIGWATAGVVLVVLGAVVSSRKSSGAASRSATAAVVSA